MSVLISLVHAQRLVLKATAIHKLVLIMSIVYPLVIIVPMMFVNQLVPVLVLVLLGLMLGWNAEMVTVLRTKKDRVGLVIPLLVVIEHNVFMMNLVQHNL